MGKQRIPNIYFVQFHPAVSLETALEIFEPDEYDIDIAPALPGSFLLASSLSYSKIRFCLESYEEEHRDTYKERIVVKLKGDSEPDHRRFC